MSGAQLKLYYDNEFLDEYNCITFDWTGSGHSFIRCIPIWVDPREDSWSCTWMKELEL